MYYSLGLRGAGTHLLGEAKWQNRPLGMREFRALIAKTPRVPKPAGDPSYVLWGRNGVDAVARNAGAIGFDLSDILST